MLQTSLSTTMSFTLQRKINELANYYKLHLLEKGKNDTTKI